MSFKWQSPTEIVTSFTDSDWAGCAKTAKSTSGGIVCIGEHVIKTYSRQQRVIALSSAEAELYAMVAASAESLAVIAYAKDMGIGMIGEVYVDSSAALGISQRCGIGKVRHLRTQGLWVQEARLTGRLAYRKVLGTKNPADVLTKHVPAELLQRHLETLCTEVRGGRAEAAPELNSLESIVLEIAGNDEYGELLGRPCKSSCGCLGECDERCRRLASKKKKEVKFATKAQVRAIPSENKGRKCKGQARKKMETRLKKPSSSAGGAIHKLQAESPMLRPRWADVCEEEEEKERIARTAAAINGSGESEIVVDNVEAEVVGKTKASDGSEGRDRAGNNLYRVRQHDFVRAPSQVLLDSERYLTGKVPSLGRQSISLNRLSKGELWDSGVSEGYQGWALTNDVIAPSRCKTIAGHG